MSLFAPIRNEFYDSFEDAIDRTVEVDKTKNDIILNGKHDTITPSIINEKLTLSFRGTQYLLTEPSLKQLFARLKTHLSTDYLSEISINQLRLDNLNFVLQKMFGKTLTFRTEGDILRAVVGKRYAAYSNFALLSTLKNHTNFPTERYQHIYISDYKMRVDMLSPDKLSASTGDISEFGLNAVNSESGRSCVGINYIIYHSHNGVKFNIVIPTNQIVSGRIRHVGEINKINNYVANLANLVYKNIDDIKEKWKNLPDKKLSVTELSRAFFYLTKIVGQKLTQTIADESTGILIYKDKKPTIQEISAYSFINSIMASIYDEIKDQEVKGRLEEYVGSYI